MDSILADCLAKLDLIEDVDAETLRANTRSLIYADAYLRSVGKTASAVEPKEWEIYLPACGRAGWATWPT